MKPSLFTKIPDYYVDYIKRIKDFNMPVQHYHDNYEIYFQISGKRQIFLNGDMWLFDAGCISLTAPFVLHYSASSENPVHERFVMNFSRKILDEFLSENETDSILSFFANGPVVIPQNFIPILTYLFQSAKNDTYPNTQAFHILQILHCITDNSEPMKTEKQNNKYTMVSKAIKYINDNYSREITVSEAAEYVHLSRFHFCRIFKEVTGETFLHYLNMTRLKNAHKLLLESDMFLNDIAIMSGFCSGANLTRIFKEKYNMTPREFKKKNII